MNTKSAELSMADPHAVDKTIDEISEDARKRDIQIRLARQGVDAAPLLTIAWATLVASGIPDDQALNDVIYSHEEILNKFINYTKDDTERGT